MRETSRRRWNRRIHVGFAVTAVAALASGLLLTVWTGRIRGEVKQLVWRADRSTVLLARIGRDTARLQSTALRAVADPASVDSSHLALLSRIEAEVGELEELLSPNEREVWAGLQPKLHALHGDLHSVSSSRAVHPVVAGGIRRRIEAIHDELGWLGRANESESHRLLAAADGHLRELQSYQLALAAGLLVVLGLVWAGTIRQNRLHRQQVIDAIRRQSEANRELDAFAGRLAHDVKNMFTPLLGLDEILATCDRGLAATIGVELRHRGERGLRLMNGLLAFSRAGAPSGERDACAVGSCLEAVLLGLRPQIEELQVEVEVDVGAVRVACAPGLLDSLLTNLVGNAVKFLEGQEERRVRVTARAEPPWAVIEVEDTGPGVPEEARGRLFEPFYRVEGTSAPGVGLGLATVARIVEAHHGSIEVVPTAGQGTCFRVRLPQAMGAGASVLEGLGDPLTADSGTAPLVSQRRSA